MHISPERNPSKTSCFRSSDQNASVARIRSTATVLISTNSEVADISSRGLQQKKQIIFQQEKQQVVCVSKYVSWHGKKVVLFLFFSWNKILDDIRPCLLATSKFGNFPPGCLNPRRDQGNTLLWKQKKCSVNKNHKFLLFEKIFYYNILSSKHSWYDELHHIIYYFAPECWKVWLLGRYSFKGS